MKKTQWDIISLSSFVYGMFLEVRGLEVKYAKTHQDAVKW